METDGRCFGKESGRCQPRIPRESSSSSTRYEALLYEDGSTSCNCPGWTRRCTHGPGGIAIRSCKHTRSIDMGRAADDAISLIDQPA